MRMNKILPQVAGVRHNSLSLSLSLFNDMKLKFYNEGEQAGTNNCEKQNQLANLKTIVIEQ